MRAADQLQAVGLVEVRADIAAKQVPRAARAQAPALDVLRIAPQQVAHRAVVRHLLLAVDRADLRLRLPASYPLHVKDTLTDLLEFIENL